jgi:hypothetical protein
MLPGIIPLPALNSRFQILEATADATADSATVTHLAYGGPNGQASTRLVVVVLTWTFVGSLNVNSATINGVACTIVGQNDGTNCGAGVIQAVVPNTEELTISVTYNGTPIVSYAQPFVMHNLLSTAVFDGSAAAGGASASRSADLDVQDNGIVMCGAFDNTGNPSFTGATEITQSLTNAAAFGYYLGNAEAPHALSATCRVIISVSYS